MQLLNSLQAAQDLGFSYRKVVFTRYYVLESHSFIFFVLPDNCLVNFLLMGISCPRSAKPGLNGNAPVDAEPYGNEALNFVKEKVVNFGN